MDDQNQQDQINPSFAKATADKAKLTPEEELNVLEAVWKIGEEKGLNLLRPEQMKKLADSGRILQPKGNGKLNIINHTNNNVFRFKDIIIGELCNRMSEHIIDTMGRDYWASMSESEKGWMINQSFVAQFGMLPNQYAATMLTGRISYVK